jgi:hypothetical protein
VKTLSTFAFLAVLVALAGVCVFSSGSLFASPTALPSSDDPLTNHLAIVDPPTRTLEQASAQTPAAPNGGEATTLNNWAYTASPSSRSR